MFTLKKILTSFFLPPGIFILLLIFSGIWFLYKKNLKAGGVNITIGAIMWLLSIPPVSDTMLRSLEAGFPVSRVPQGDVIIFLGGDVYNDRILSVVKLRKRLSAPIILSGGKVFEHEKAVAHGVRGSLIDLGVPADEIIVEDKSRDTFENARYVREICTKLGYKNPILVTSPHHLRRAIMSFEKVGIKVIPFTGVFKSLQDKQYGWNNYLPHDFTGVSTAIREYLGLLFYRVAY